MSIPQPLHLFEGIGIELEYMIVDDESLRVAPITDWLLHSFSGAYQSEVEGEAINWSNELVLHVVELKTNGPARALAALPELFQRDIAVINERLRQKQARLMPTAMHPGMNPELETRLWPHEYNQIYEAFNAIFDCRGHGWSNLQSLHINLPFCGEEEFGRLHAAIRVLLPLLPALAASSPIVEYAINGIVDNRMQFYRYNSAKIPAVSGQLVPEAVFTFEAYEKGILQPLYQDLAPFDPDELLQEEWANARGAIARFQRNTIEIRVLDVQECPAADLAIAWAVVKLLQHLTQERWSLWTQQKDQCTHQLADLLYDTSARGGQAPLRIPHYTTLFGCEPTAIPTVDDLWRHLLTVLFREMQPEEAGFRKPLETIMKQGPLSKRIQRRLGCEATPQAIDAVYRQLCECLAQGEMFYCE